MNNFLLLTKRFVSSEVEISRTRIKSTTIGLFLEGSNLNHNANATFICIGANQPLNLNNMIIFDNQGLLWSYNINLL